MRVVYKQPIEARIVQESQTAMAMGKQIDYIELTKEEAAELNKFMQGKAIYATTPKGVGFMFAGVKCVEKGD